MKTKNIILTVVGLTFFITLFLTLKASKNVDSKTKKYSIVDSLEQERKIDSMVTAHMEDSRKKYEQERDSIAKKESPIQVTDVDIYTGEYSSFQSIRIKYKNVSNKTVVATKFSWFDCKDVFGDPIEFSLGYTGGWSDNIIKPGLSSSSSFDLLQQGVKSGRAYCFEVAFDDGTKWELK